MLACHNAQRVTNRGSWVVVVVFPVIAAPAALDRFE
jgi:hypothetical protein